MKRNIYALILSALACNAWAQGATSTIGGTTDWYWKLYRTSTDGNLNFYNRRNVTDPEVLRIKFLDQGGLQLIGGNLYSDRSLFLGGATDYYWRMERVQGDGRPARGGAHAAHQGAHLRVTFEPERCGLPA